MRLVSKPRSDFQIRRRSVTALAARQRYRFAAHWVGRDQVGCGSGENPRLPGVSGS